MGNKNDAILLTETYSHPLKLVESKATPSGEYTNAVIATLYGILSDFSQKTRNDRWYTGKLWRKVLNSDNFKEAIDTKTLLGEPDHPLDIENRLETHIPNVSHIVRDVTIDDIDQAVKGYLDILDTPSGRIIKTLIDYGCILGVSSRGSGDLVERNGEDYVDEDTYNFITWDIVARPSNLRARMKSTNESIESSNVHESLMAQVSQMIKDKNIVGLKLSESLINNTDVPGKNKIIKVINEAVGVSQEVIVDPEKTEVIDSAIDKSTDVVSNDPNVIMTMRKDLDDAYARIITLKADNKAKDLENKELNDEVERLRSTISDLESVNHNLEMIVSENFNSDSSDNTNTHDDIESSIEKHEEATKKLISEMKKSIFAKLDKLNEKYEELSDVDKVVTDNVELVQQVKDLKSELSDKDKELTDAKNEAISNKKKYSKIIKEYFSLRCNQLGINETIAKKQFGDTLAEYELSDIDDILNELYVTNSKTTKILSESMKRKSSSTVGKSLGSISVKRSMINESYNDDTDSDSDFDLTSAIRATRNQI